MNSFVFFNGKFVPEEEAVISVKTHALQYGTGCFEGIRAYYNAREKALFAFRLKEHYERLSLSGRVLFMNLSYTVDELCNITVELLQKNFEETDTYIRPFLFKSDAVIGNFNLQKLATSLVIYTVPLGRYLNTEAGVKANISSWRRIPDNAIPPRAKISGAYVNTALAKTESLLNGFDEALMLDFSGHIVEGSAENFFIVKNGTLVTPVLSDDILVGITRQTVLEIIEKELKLKVVERSIDRTEAYQADEVFVVGTGAEVTPVIEIDKRQIGNGGIGPITSKIKDIYNKMVRGQLPKYKQYTTKITPKK